MKLVSKAVAFSAAAALTATGLVAAAGTSANAATVPETYSCVTPVGTYDVPVDFTLPSLPTSLPAGSKVPSIPVSATMSLPQALLTPLGSLLSSGGVTSLGGSITGTGALGSVPVPASLTLPTTSLADAASGLKATGSLDSFTAPTTPGTYTFSVPSTITANLVSALGDAGAAKCTLKGSAAVGSVKVVAAGHATPTKAQKKLTKDEKALKKAKKAFKKAHGAKKAKLHKKIVKLKKAIKKDKKAVKAGK